jgi:hypothetical protein
VDHARRSPGPELMNGVRPRLADLGLIVDGRNSTPADDVGAPKRSRRPSEDTMKRSNRPVAGRRSAETVVMVANALGWRNAASAMTGSPLVHCCPL